MESLMKGHISTQIMEAIILAGGFGTRLRQVVPDLPKPMAPIAGRPFLEILLISLAHKGFHRVVISLGYMADTVVKHFGDQFAGMEIVYEIELAPLGTGGAVRQALARCNADHVFVFNGDTFLDLETADVEDHWQRHQVPIIVARNASDTVRYGCLGFCIKKSLVVTGLINAGCYVLPPNILDGFVLGQPFSLETDFLAKAVGTQRFDFFVTNGHFIDIGVPEDYARAQTELAVLYPFVS
jgi:D-glycero-alpha-D-manno-heptose 1-phosphate guanylyltransferase